MLSSNLYKGLIREFDEVKRGKNPQVTSDLEAVVVLSGESSGSTPGVYSDDTEQRTALGIRIYKMISRLGGFCFLLLNGTDIQNQKMQKLAKDSGVEKIMLIENPPFPAAATETQFIGMKKLNFKKLAIVTHAYHAPRTILTAKKIIPKVSCKMFLLDRRFMKIAEIDSEINKILRYFYE